MSHGQRGQRRVAYFATQDEAWDAYREVQGGFVWRAAGEEGQRILDQFDERAPFIKKAAKRAEQRAKQRGYVLTWGGRRLNFKRLQDGSYDYTHKAFNRVIQGTSADQTKAAMVEADRAGHWLMIQVHDELGSSVADRDEAKAIAEIMENAMPARVPFRVDVEIKSWGEAV